MSFLYSMHQWICEDSRRWILVLQRLVRTTTRMRWRTLLLRICTRTQTKRLWIDQRLYLQDNSAIMKPDH